MFYLFDEGKKRKQNPRTKPNLEGRERKPINEQEEEKPKENEEGERLAC